MESLLQRHLANQHWVLDAILERWVSGDRDLNAPVRCGLVLCIPFLRPALRASLAPELERLLQHAGEDDDAWVRILARALGTNPCRTDLDAVAADVPPVADTLSALRITLAAGTAPAVRDFRPLEEACFSDALKSRLGAPLVADTHSHFTVRQPPQQSVRDQVAGRSAVPAKPAVVPRVTAVPAPACMPPPSVTAPLASQQPVRVPPLAPPPPAASRLASTGAGPGFRAAFQDTRLASRVGGSGLAVGKASMAGQKRKMQMIDSAEVAQCLKQAGPKAGAVELPDELDVRSKAMATEREKLKATMKEREELRKRQEAEKRRQEAEKIRAAQAHLKEVHRADHMKDEQRIRILAAQKEKEMLEQRALWAARNAPPGAPQPSRIAQMMANRTMMAAAGDHGTAPQRAALPVPGGAAGPILTGKVVAGPSMPLDGRPLGLPQQQLARPQARPTTPSPTAAHVATPTPPKDTAAAAQQPATFSLVPQAAPAQLKS